LKKGSLAFAAAMGLAKPTCWTLFIICVLPKAIFQNPTSRIHTRVLRVSG
jgi:hypothetical protein